MDSARQPLILNTALDPTRPKSELVLETPSSPADAESKAGNVSALRPNNDPSFDLPRPSHRLSHSIARKYQGADDDHTAVSPPMAQAAVRALAARNGRPPANTDEAITASTEDQSQGDRHTTASIASTKPAQ